MRFARPTALFAVLTLGLHSVAWACSCRTSSLEEHLEDADLVIFGHVLEVGIEGPYPRLKEVDSGGCGGPTVELQLISSSGDRKMMRVEVLEAFQGSARPGDEVAIETVAFGASCGLDAQEGEDWLFFVGASGTAYLCGGSSRVDDPDTHPGLAALDAL